MGSDRIGWDRMAEFSIQNCFHAVAAGFVGIIPLYGFLQSVFQQKVLIMEFEKFDKFSSLTSDSEMDG